jgi:hypothetical protein
MVPEAKGIVMTSTQEDFKTNLKSENGDPKLKVVQCSSNGSIGTLDKTISNWG